MNPIQDVLFQLDWVNWDQGPAEWWRNARHIERILAAADASGLGPDLEYCGQYGTRLEKPASKEELLKKTTTWEPSTYTLGNNEQGGDITLQLGLRNQTLSLSLVIEGSSLEARRASILDQLVKFACHLDEAFRDEALLGPFYFVTVVGVEYPRVRPPRRHRRWPSGSLVDFVSRPFHEQHRAGDPTAWEKLCAAPLPEGASREIHDQLLTLRWVENLVDESLVSLGRSSQARWLGEILDWPIDSRYNEAGDLEDELWEPEPYPPLTFYDEESREGYKAVVPGPDGDLDPALLAEMRAWIKAGALPDGEHLEHLHWIVPSREAALTVREQANVLGVEKVLYADDEANLWNPWPPGPWITPS